jgi:hypothetical protein
MILSLRKSYVFLHTPRGVLRFNGLVAVLQVVCIADNVYDAVRFAGQWWAWFHVLLVIAHGACLALLLRLMEHRWGETVKWFGKDWGAPICVEAPHVWTPVGEKCSWCDEPIARGENGFVLPLITREGARPAYYHYECQLRSIAGGVNHQLGLCTCCPGGALPPDPEGLSKREAARQAVETFERGKRCGR